MSSKRLSKEEWNQLDDLLGKHGYGGYYDLVEFLKMTLVELQIGNTGIDIADPEMKLNLPEATELLYKWSRALCLTEGFQNIAEEASKLFNKAGNKK